MDYIVIGAGFAGSVMAERIASVLDQEYFQGVGTVNYPNNHDFTRITEFKHLTDQMAPKPTIMREYSQDYDKDSGQVPSYPVPMEKNRSLQEI